MSCVREVEFIFSKAIPADIVTLHQRPFAMDSWRRGPHPGEVECVILYKVSIATNIDEIPKKTNHRLGAKGGCTNMQFFCSNCCYFVFILSAMLRFIFEVGVCLDV